MVLVVFGRIHHGTGLDTDLLEQIPHLLVDVLLRRKEGEKMLFVFSNWGLNQLQLTEILIFTLPVMTMQPSWSTMSTSSWEGGWQNFCCRIWRMGSITLGVSRKATEMWPKALMVWSGIKWASLGKRGVRVLILQSNEDFSFSSKSEEQDAWLTCHFPERCRDG